MRPLLSKIAVFARPKRRWFQSSVRTLLLVMAVFGLWLGFKANRANKQRRAVAAIEALGGSVGYDYVPLAPNVEQGYYLGQRSDSPPPRRLVRLFGKHYFVKVVAVHFARCPNLRDEDLGCLLGLPDIKTLELQGTKLTDAGLEKLRHLRSLSSLNLKDTRVSGRGLAQLNGSVRLSYLGLMGEQVDDGGLEQVGKFSTLEVLEIRNAAITDRGLSCLANLKNLKTLTIWDSHRFTNAGLVHLKELSNLEQLDLGRSEITDEGLAHLKGLMKLWNLVLCDMNVSDAGLEHLESLPSLKYLYLEGTWVTATGIATLQKALPSCEISR